MLIVAVVLFVLAVVVAAVGVAGLIGRLPRNRWAGVRTPEAMRDDESFKLANKVAAPTMLAAGLLLAIGGGAMVVLDGVFAVVAMLVAVVAALFTAGAGASLASRAAAAVPETGGCGHACTSCSLRDACQPT
ncbi:SdpI family protein [Antrihabitans cavernicola]|uniref:SdpI family protein n=1 Tax=Antrihabitans cavernicola TaxID=2495913 RepID=A0A5A7SL97_9NOCA|nr:SdpI family protein [Spelaeibacter cavernicola]KAA0025011.1 SdpI family protein [Spelaeibacter cavernicola]